MGKIDRVLALIFIMAIFAFVPVIILAIVFAGKLSYEGEVESEIVNGLVTVSGLIFAFQPTFFKKPKIAFFRWMFTAVFLVEALVLGITGYSYVTNTLDLGYLSRTTLFIASGSLLFNLFMTAFFVVADLVVQSWQLDK